MTHEEITEVVRPAKVRWFRRRPPQGLDRFSRGVWWAGHGQFFIAAALPFVGVALMVGVVWIHDLFFFGMLALTMAVPFLYSGAMLRGAATLPQGGPHLTFFGWVERIVVLAITVAVIAALAIAGVFVGMFAGIIVWTQIYNTVTALTGGG
ncbi:hypothetical protein [Agromyces humi]|uniref:hypothetical protein n=1 Tax=Agromyces humi TaxID=1766800 RepID=UPI00135C4C8F|nr:hypothetical protein [Agromyces humi]